MQTPVFLSPERSGKVKRKEFKELLSFQCGFWAHCQEIQNFRSEFRHDRESFKNTSGTIRIFVNCANRVTRLSSKFFWRGPCTPSPDGFSNPVGPIPFRPVICPCPLFTRGPFVHFFVILVLVAPFSQGRPG